MTFKLPRLPYSKDALAPHISQETLAFHHGKHHAAYIDKLNELIEADSSLAGKSLDDLVLTTDGDVFNQAAQAWNHDFYWHSMSPNGGKLPKGELARAIDQAFGTFSDFKEKFSQLAVDHFGSGWVWLVKDNGGRVAIVDTHDADNPLRQERPPLLTCDVWEHAYYLDHKNARPDYIAAWWHLVNWDFAGKNFG
jgi:Fe-Mn family superoxide dismutase